MTSIVRAPTDLKDSASFDHEGRTGIPDRTIGTLLADLADRDERVVCGTADLSYSTYVAHFMERHPDRFFQFGIAERNMLGAAAGMAAAGLIPYMSTFAAFAALQSLDVIRTDHAYPNVPVRTLGTHCGISMGYFASSHHAIEDIGAVRSVPNLTILSPADLNATSSLLEQSLTRPEPMYIRLGRGGGPQVYERGVTCPIGELSLLRAGTDALVVTTGSSVFPALRAADSLAEAGRADVGVVDVHTIKPFDGDALAKLASDYRLIVTVEDHNVEGGLGSIVREALFERGVAIPVHKHGIADEFAIIGPPSHMYKYYGLDLEGIETVVTRALEAETGAGPLWGAHDHERVLAFYRDRRSTRGATVDSADIIVGADE